MTIRSILHATLPLGVTLAILTANDASIFLDTSVSHAAVTQAYSALSGFPIQDPASVFFSSPAVVDLNGDGKNEVLVGDAGGCVWAWSASGARLPGFPWITSSPTCSGGARINGPLAIADIDRNGSLEVVAGTRGVGTNPGERGKTYVWRSNGTLMPGWPKEMDWTGIGNGGAEVFGIALANVVGDTKLEVLAGTSNNAISPIFLQPKNLYVWTVDGTLQPGWPTGGQRNAGIYGNIGAADITGDGYAEVITGRDELYVHVHGQNGAQVSGWPLRAYVDAIKTNYDFDPYVEFTEYIPAMADLDGDGSVEVVIAGKLREPLLNHQTTGSGVFVLEPNGSRRAGWETPRQGGGPPTTDFRPQQGPALADLNGDGRLEIVVTMLDGVLRVYRDNGTLLWSYNFAQGRVLYGTDPVVGDITGDGRLDIVFGSYSPDGSANAAAALYAVDANGQLLPGFPLPLTAEGTGTRQGLRAAPTLADLNGDGTIEILAASWAGTLYAWTLPSLYRADRMPWPTGRQNLQRTGAAPPGDAQPATATLGSPTPPTTTRTATPTRTGIVGPSPTATRTVLVGPPATAVRTATPGPSPTASRTITPGPSPTASRTATPGPSPTTAPAGAPNPNATPTLAGTVGPLITRTVLPNAGSTVGTTTATLSVTSNTTTTLTTTGTVITATRTGTAATTTRTGTAATAATTSTTTIPTATFPRSVYLPLTQR